MIWLVLLTMALVLCLWLLRPLWLARDRSVYVIAVMLLAGAGALYAALGTPGVAGQPYAARWQDVRFAEQSGDAAFAEGDIPAAITAYRRALAVVPASDRPMAAGLHARLGEALVVQQNGTVTPAAGKAFAEALRLNPREPRARFYAGVALIQHGEAEAALAVWRELAKDSPPDAPWRKALLGKIP